MQCGHFAEMIEGYQDKKKQEYGIHLSLIHALRKQAFVSVLPHAAKGFSFNTFTKNFWPLPGDETAEEQQHEPSIDAELYAEMVKAHNLGIQKSRRDATTGIRHRRKLR